MTTKLIVCVTAQGAIVSLFERGNLTPCRKFTATEASLQAFGELLREHPAVPVDVMVDSVEEDYRTEVLPHASGAARNELLQRKLKQLYRSTPYYTAWVQGRDTGKRRDDRYLFAALTNTEMLRPWLEVLNQHQASLAGIYLLPMVSQELISLLKVTQPELLLVSRHLDGLRQSFFQDGQLKASRLAVVDADNVPATALMAEIGKTRLYLHSLRLTARESKLAVLLLDSGDNMEDLQQCLQADPSFFPQRMTRRDLGLRLKGIPPGICPYSMHMTALGLQPPAHNLAPANLTRNHWLHRQRRLLYVASAVAATVTMLWAGTNLTRHYQLDGETRLLAEQTQSQLARYIEVTKTFPQAPATADSLEKAVQIAGQLNQDSRSPDRLMLVVSRALEASPEVTLTRLTWKYGAPGENAEKSQGNIPSGADNRWQVSGGVEAEIRPFSGDYRAAMASINRFADKLKNDPEVANASVTQMPLNIHSASALSGNTLDTASADSVRAEFKLRLVLKARS